MTAAVAIEPTAVRAATIAPPTAAASRTGRLVRGRQALRQPRRWVQRAVPPRRSPGRRSDQGDARDDRRRWDADGDRPRGGDRSRSADDRGRSYDDRRGASADGPRRGPAGARDGDRRRPYDRAGGAPRRDDRSRAGTSADGSADGARTGDVREGRWSDTWSDRRKRDDRSGGEGQGSRERQTTPAPPLSDAIAASALDPAARRDLLGLQKDVAEAVARHLVAAGTLVDEDPEAALAHARYARRRASRIAVVREAAGITAYHAGEWAEALAELRAARRMGGGPGHLAVMADIERAMGRPERAIELARSPEARELDRNAQIELAIVVAGARRDLGEIDAAVVALQVPELEASRRDPWSARLFYAYADNLLAAGRESDALQWFVHAADADTEGETDADARIADLTGEPLADDGIEFGLDDETPGDDPAAAPTYQRRPVTAEDADTTADTTADATADKASEVETDEATDQQASPAAAAATDDTALTSADQAPGAGPMTPTPRPSSQPLSRRTTPPTTRPRRRLMSRLSTWLTARPASRSLSRRTTPPTTRPRRRLMSRLRTWPTARPARQPLSRRTTPPTTRPRRQLMSRLRTWPTARPARRLLSLRMTRQAT